VCKKYDSSFATTHDSKVYIILFHFVVSVVFDAAVAAVHYIIHGSNCNFIRIEFKLRWCRYR
jgi:hypothetical protein